MDLMNNTNIVFLVEGDKEESLIKQLIHHFETQSINAFPKAHIIIYKTCIYDLFKKLQADSDLDTFQELKDKDDKKILDGIEQQTMVSQIYLLFDYDPHASNASDNKLQKLLDFFDDEFDKGKLYISYPMIEAFRHGYKIIKSGSSIENLCNQHKIDELRNYKSHVSSLLPEIIHIDCIDTIKKLILESLFHAQHLVNTAFEYPTHKEIISQINIFNKQKEKYSDENNYPFYILSSIPLFTFEYHKEEVFKQNFDI